MKKIVLQLEYADDRIRQKAMQRVTGIRGVESVHIDPKDKKLTLTGDVDVASMVVKLRKLCHAEVLSVAPVENKKDEPIKDAPVEKKKDEPSKEAPKENSAETPKPIQPLLYNPYHVQHHYQQLQTAVPAFVYHSADDNPNYCVIC